MAVIKLDTLQLLRAYILCSTLRRESNTSTYKVEYRRIDSCFVAFHYEISLESLKSQ